VSQTLLGNLPTIGVLAVISGPENSVLALEVLCVHLSLSVLSINLPFLVVAWCQCMPRTPSMPSMLCRAQLLYPGRRYAQLPNKMRAFSHSPFNRILRYFHPHYRANFAIHNYNRQSHHRSHQHSDQMSPQHSLRPASSIYSAPD
jgi:hypothetical protein